MEYNYSNPFNKFRAGKSIWKWVLIYVLIGAVAYGLVYLAFFYKKGGGGYDNQEVESEILTNDSPVAQTYTSDNYYFSVLWPPNWKIEKNNMGILLSGKEGMFNISWSGGGACDEDKITQFTKKEDFYWICDSKPDGSYLHATISKKSNENIAIGVIPSASYSTEDGKWIFLKVLENIRLDPQGIASWKTYNNNQYGFTFKYPENFFVEEPLMVANQCDFEKFSKECPDRKDEKIIIKKVQYCHNQHNETSSGITYYYDSYMAVRNYDAYEEKNSNFCLSVLLKTSEGSERVKTLEKIVPTFKFTDYGIS